MSRAWPASSPREEGPRSEASASRRSSCRSRAAATSLPLSGSSSASLLLGCRPENDAGGGLTTEAARSRAARGLRVQKAQTAEWADRMGVTRQRPAAADGAARERGCGASDRASTGRARLRERRAGRRERRRGRRSAVVGRRWKPVRPRRWTHDGALPPPRRSPVKPIASGSSPQAAPPVARHASFGAEGDRSTAPVDRCLFRGNAPRAALPPSPRAGARPARRPPARARHRRSGVSGGRPCGARRSGPAAPPPAASPPPSACARAPPRGRSPPRRTAPAPRARPPA